MGKSGKDNKKPDGGLFDFNKDGKTTWIEKTIAFKMFEKFQKENEDADLDDLLLDCDLDFDSDTYEWRISCADGSEFGVDPEDYETEEEYNEALAEEQYAWRDICEDGLDEEVDPEDYETEEEYEEALEEAQSYNTNVTSIPISIEISFVPQEDATDKIKEADFPNKRQYNAAYALAELGDYCDSEYEKKEKARCEFILGKSDTVIAAKYLTYDGDFLYAQAIKDNFKLPIALPDEDAEREFEFSDILRKIGRKDISLCLTVWIWCLEQFMDYTEYDEYSKATLTNDMLDELYNFSDEFKMELIKYMSEHSEFRKIVVRGAKNITNNLAELIVRAIQLSMLDTAKALFEDGLAIVDGKWKPIIELTGEVINYSKNYQELETIEYVEQELLPLVRAYSDEMIADEIEVWDENIAEYKRDIEQSCDQYAYTRSNAWRQSIDIDKYYGLDPRYYNSENEYLEAVNEKKYRWRCRFNNRDIYKLNPEDYETKTDFLKALILIDDKRERECAKHYKEEMKNGNVLPAVEDTNIYIYCGVELPNSMKPYSFRTNDTNIKISDSVIVPIGREQKETKGTVVSVGQYTRTSVPYPVEKTKFILRKVNEEIE
ncbi:MAG: hypothetical protein RR892_06800 [Lachnospiraceae bacterium]